MSHFIVTYGADRDGRVPHFLKGSLTPVQVANYEDIGTYSLRPFWNEKTSRYEFGSDLYFVSRERKIEIDFYPVADGFLASETLSNLLSDLAPEAVRSMRVEMIPRLAGPIPPKE